MRFSDNASVDLPSYAPTYRQNRPSYNQTSYQNRNATTDTGAWTHDKSGPAHDKDRFVASSYEDRDQASSKVDEEKQTAAAVAAGLQARGGGEDEGPQMEEETLETEGDGGGMRAF